MSGGRIPGRRKMATGTEAPPKHGVGGWRSLFISTLILLGVVLLWQALTPTVERVEQPGVDVPASGRYAEEQTGWPLHVPDLGPEWRATSARFEPRAGARTWEVGYVRTDDASVFVSVAQTGDLGDAASAEDWLRQYTRGGGGTDTVVIDGRQWQGFTAQEDNPRHALVPAKQGEVAIAVSGLGDPANLVVVAESLRPLGTTR